MKEFLLISNLQPNLTSLSKKTTKKMMIKEKLKKKLNKRNRTDKVKFQRGLDLIKSFSNYNSESQYCMQMGNITAGNPTNVMVMIVAMAFVALTEAATVSTANG